VATSTGEIFPEPHLQDIDFKVQIVHKNAHCVTAVFINYVCQYVAKTYLVLKLTIEVTSKRAHDRPYIPANNKATQTRITTNASFPVQFLPARRCASSVWLAVRHTPIFCLNG